MANTYSISVHGLPNPDNMAPGKSIAATDIRALTGTMNHLHGQMRAQPVIAQTWGHTQAVRVGATAQLAEWRIPVLSSNHLSLTCEVLANAARAAGGTVIFKSSSASVHIAVATTALTYHSGTLNTIDVSTAAYDDITMEVLGAATVNIRSVLVAFDPLTSPLATSAVSDGFVPFGANASAADYTLSTVRGRHVVDGLNALIARPRCVLAWSGLETTNISGATAKGNARKELGIYGTGEALRQFFRVAPDILASDYSDYEVWIKATNNSASDQVVSVTWAPGDGSEYSGEVETATVPATSGTAWYQITPRMREGDNVRGITAVPGVSVAIRRQNASVVRGQGYSTATILAVSVWGR